MQDIDSQNIMESKVPGTKLLVLIQQGGKVVSAADK